MSPTGYGAVSNAFVRALGIHDHSQIGSRAGVRLAFVLLPIRLCAPCHTPCIENYSKLNKSRPMGENVMMDKLDSADDQVQADEAATSRRHVFDRRPRAGRVSRRSCAGSCAERTPARFAFFKS